MATLIIDGINVNNDHMIDEIAGIAGYARTREFINECSCKIEIDEDDLHDKYYSRKIKEMIGEYVMNGFAVSWED